MQPKFILRHKKHILPVFMIVLNVNFITCGLRWYHKLRPCLKRKRIKFINYLFFLLFYLNGILVSTCENMSMIPLNLSQGITPLMSKF